MYFINYMKNYIKSFLFIFLASCSGIGTKHLIGNYYLTKIDYSDIELDLSYKIESSGDFLGVVNPTVFAIGYNDEYIIVKQRPRNINHTTPCSA